MVLDLQDSTDQIKEQADLLVQRLAEIGPCIVAFSGGVDSSVVAFAAFKALKQQCIAVTGLGAAVSQLDREFALDVIAQIGMRHEFLNTYEIDDHAYIRNDRKRCFYCKSELYTRLQLFAREMSIANLVSGTNVDDLGDYRPGLEAAKSHGVYQPLADLNIGKQSVRKIAAMWGLSIASRPASPCLSSRIAYGTAVTPERLRMIESAESMLHQLGFDEVRVRYLPGSHARIELPAHRLAEFQNSVDVDSLGEKIRALGFAMISVDHAGLQSGGLNRMLPILQ